MAVKVRAFLVLENLRNDLMELEKRFGQILVENLPFTINKVRREKVSAADILTESQKRVCYEKNKPIFEKFGYERQCPSFDLSMYVSDDIAK